MTLFGGIQKFNSWTMMGPQETPQSVCEADNGGPRLINLHEL